MNFSLHNNRTDRNKPKAAVFCLAILACALLFATHSYAAVRSSANFTMNSDVLDSGGGSASSANFQLNGSIGQSTPVGPTASTNFNVLSGYFPGILFEAIKFNNDVVVNLPTGVTILFNDNSSSNVLHPDTAAAIAVADVDGNGEGDVIASFPSGSGPGGTGGTFISRNGAALVLLDPNIADEIVSGNFDGAFGDDLMLNSGPAGLSLVLNDTGIIPFIPVPTSAIAAGDVDNTGLDDLIFAIAGFGTVVLKDFSTVDILDPGAADELAVADVDNNGEQDVIASFPAGVGPTSSGGTWVSQNQGVLTLLDTKTAEEIAVGDFDDNGPNDLLIDFGADNLWLSLDGTPPILFIDLPISAVGAGDLDSNGTDDMLFSFTGIGTFFLKNLVTFDVLDPGVAVDMTTGDIDGN